MGGGAVSGESSAMGKTAVGERERESDGPLVSSRAESSDSKRSFHIMILQQCIAYFKDLITTAY